MRWIIASNWLRSMVTNSALCRGIITKTQFRSALP
jgi:hypothetical protein